METKHTPGPWNAAIHFGRYDQPIIIGNKSEIARLNSFSNKQYKANAKLIAAAPEMLEALVAFIESQSCDGNGRVTVNTQKHRSAVYLAEEAIKKATEL